MLGFRGDVVPAAILATTMALPAAAQPSEAPSTAVSSANMSDATVKKVGMALRQVAQIEET
jgi:hypothetical protein